MLCADLTVFVVSVSEIWGLLGLHLADDAVLPFDYLSYATQLQVVQYLGESF